MTTELLRAEDVRVTFAIRREGDMPWTKPRLLQAVAGVNFTLAPGETLGIVGESGCGKSTLARALIQMVPGTGRVVWMGKTDLLGLGPRDMLKYRSEIQMVFQDPFGSLDPRQTVARIVAEPLAALASPHTPSRAEQRERVSQALQAVGLRQTDLDKFPHEFSGGQRQRIAIARALITRPKLIVADEPVSALDVSVQAQVLNLMMDLQEQFGVTYLLISHDLAVVQHLCDDVAVMQGGQIVERGSPQTLFTHPVHPYTRKLVDAVPRVSF